MSVRAGPSGHTPSEPGRSAALFRQAFARHRAGDLPGASRLYREVLAVDPAHADSLQLLGLVTAQAGRLEEAAALIGQAVALKPDFALAHFNLGNVRRRLGQGEAAAAAYRRAIELEPESPKWLINLGVALRELGQDEAAMDAYRRAIVLKPDYAEAYYNLGVVLQAGGRCADAVEAYGEAVRLRPDFADAYGNLAATLLALGRPAEAVAACRSRIGIEPSAGEAYHVLSTALLELGQSDAAAMAARRAVELRPDDADAHSQLGQALRDIGRTAPSLAAFRRAAELSPRSADTWVNLAIALQETGEAAEAEAAIDRAMALDRASAAAWAVRAARKRFPPGDPDIAAMESLLAAVRAAGGPLEDRLHLEFALGKAFMDTGEADLAFAHLAAGNSLKRGTLRYDVRDDAAQFEQIARSLDRPVMNRLARAGDPSEQPVFVIGMPRSGTTLVEQILASHPDVHGAGELTVLEEVLVDRLGGSLSPLDRAGRLATLSPDDLLAMGSAYVARVGARSPGAARITDKMPANFRFAGLIGLMLPNARIVHCRRDPADTCLSCFAQKFARGQSFSYDLGDLGLYYRAYDTLMSHWRRVIAPDRLLEVRYEDVVADVESQARRLIAFCGLDWDDACLDFHRTRRPVRTASVNQVRQPIYTTGLARWRAYEAHLRPLLEILA